MTTDERLTTCINAINHTPCPSDYMGWHAWARKKSRTHKQVKCTGCDLYAIWLPKKSNSAQ